MTAEHIGYVAADEHVMKDPWDYAERVVLDPFVAQAWADINGGRVYKMTLTVEELDA